MNQSGQTGPADVSFHSFFETMNRASYAAIARATGGLSPATMVQAWADWAVHLAASPGKRMELMIEAARGAAGGSKAMRDASESPGAVGTVPPDHRFTDPAWGEWPFAPVMDQFLACQAWWREATDDILGVSRHHQAIVSFMARQLLDMVAPSNLIATNPVLQRRIVETGGQCLFDGMRYLFEDIERMARALPPAGMENFEIGKDLAATEGKVVFRNHLIELIQYSPSTETVKREPVLIVPAWIMKYYILDLSPSDSLIAWLVEQGHTVFAISWHNPDSSDRDLGLDDYRHLGPMAALDAIEAITGPDRIHALGYCLGGTLMAITAAAMARDGDERLASLTLLAAQTEFSEPGELGLFIDEAQVNLLESAMWSRGYLDSDQMGSAFQMLRSNDLIWSRILTTYLMGEREPLNDLMAWNADGTRMPYAMHSEYLRSLFLEDALAEGHYKADGRSVSLSALRLPIFVVGTERDHVAPWPSVHKIHWLTPAPITFVLTSGGHNAGIVSEPGHPHRHYRMASRPQDGPALSCEEWLDTATRHEGSWWQAWNEWLNAHSTEPGPPPQMGKPGSAYAPLCDAPGTYVMEH